MDVAEKKTMEHDRWVAQAPNYARNVVDGRLVHTVYDMFISNLVPALKTKEKVAILDIAAASGEPAMSLAVALPQSQVISTDFSEAYLEIGQARAEKLGISNLKFDTADGENLHQFSDASFDVVTCSLGLMFMPTFEKALQEFYRVLLPGGTTAATFWGSLDQVHFMRVVVDVSRQLNPTLVPPEGTSVITATRLTPQEVIDGATAAGFVDVKHTPFEVEFSLGTDWWEVMVDMPFPLAKYLAIQKEQGNLDAMGHAKGLLEEAFRAGGWLTEQGGVRIPGNVCNYVECRKPSPA